MHLTLHPDIWTIFQIQIMFILTIWLVKYSQIYPSELQLIQANTSDTEAAFLDLHLSISNDIVYKKL